MAGMEKIYISASTYLHEMTSTQAAQLSQPQEHCSNTNKREHQLQLSKLASKVGACSPNSGMWKRHTGEWKWNPWWSKGMPKSGPDQFQQNQTNSGKFSNSFPCKTLSIHIRNLLFLSNKHTNKKYHNRVSYCEYVQLTSQKRRRKASLATQWSWRIIEVTTCSQWSRRIPTRIRHKNRRPKISRKLIIDSNKLYDYIHDTNSHAMKIHNLHDATHDLVTMNHEKHESPKKPTKASHEARCTAAVRKVQKKTADNIKRSHSLKNVPKVLVELRRSRGPPRAWRWHRTIELMLVRVKTIEIQAVALAPSEPVHSYADEDNTKGWATDREETNAARVRRPTKVIELRNLTLVKISSINFVRYEGAYRAQRTSLPENRRTYVEIVKELLEEKNTVLPLRPKTHKVQNPKA